MLDSVSQVPQEAILPSSAQPAIPAMEPLRRSDRGMKNLTWMGDYITATTTLDSHIPFFIQNYLSYAKLKPYYQIYLAAFTSITEPKTFSETS